MRQRLHIIEATRESHREDYGRVTFDGAPLDPAPSLAVWNHSPSGFAWGYGGSGPSQLALAILLAAGIEERRAVRHHQAFKWAHIASQPQTGTWTLRLDVDAWVRDQERHDDPTPPADDDGPWGGGFADNH